MWLWRSSHSKDELLVGWTTLLVVSFVCNLWQGIAFSTGLCFQPCWSKNRNAWLSVITSCSIFSASHRCPNPHLHITNLKIAYPLSVVGLIISNQLTQWDTQQHISSNCTTLLKITQHFRGKQGFFVTEIGNSLWFWWVWVLKEWWWCRTCRVRVLNQHGYSWNWFSSKFNTKNKKKKVKSQHPFFININYLYWS